MTEQKKRKQPSAVADNCTTDHTSTSASATANDKGRNILFVGNLPYSATSNAIKAHFGKKCTSVRIRTDKQTGKPKGFAFVEFRSADALKTALLLHHSMMGDRKINVELTAGGGGNSKERRRKIEQKNKKVQK